MVIGPPIAVAYQLTAGDTLGEIPSEDVPAAVSRSAQREATRIGYSADCTRYFRGLTVYVTLLKVSCRAGETVDDGEAVAAYSEDGKAAGDPLLSLRANAYTRLVPEARPRSTDPEPKP
jgi:hypothetical protein